MRVPRGQASYALGHVHYNYPAAGGSPPNYLMCAKLEEITLKVNSVLGTNFNTILLNKYVTGEDHIGYHSDNETGWAKGSGFATLAFGTTRSTPSGRLVPLSLGYTVDRRRSSRRWHLAGPSRGRSTSLERARSLGRSRVRSATTQPQTRACKHQPEDARARRNSYVEDKSDSD